MSNVIHLFQRKISRSLKDSSKTLDLLAEDAQLSLQFNAPSTLYIISGEIGGDSDNFYYFASQELVKTIFDMRFSPRLDFIASTRKKAFDFFEKIGLKYFDVLGRHGVENISIALDDRHEILKDVITSAEKDYRHDETFLMIFDNNLLATEYSRTIRQYFNVKLIDKDYIERYSSENIKLQM
jgi:hypothetical protein